MRSTSTRLLLLLVASGLIAGLYFLSRPLGRPLAKAAPQAKVLSESTGRAAVQTALPNTAIAPQAEPEAEPPSPVTEFDRWSKSYLSAKANDRSAMVEKGVELAQARRPVFHGLIKSDPEGALKQAVPMVVRQQLPDRILEHLEERLNGTAVLRVLQAAPLPEEPIPARSLNFREAEFKGGKTYRAYVYGRRAASLQWVPGASLNGVAIDSDFAVNESPSRTLETGERPTLEKLAVTSCPVSGLTAVDEEEIPEVITENTPAIETATEVIYFCSNIHIDLHNQTLIMGEGVSGGAFGFTGILPAAPTPALGVVKVLAIPMSFADQNSIPSTEAQLSATLRDVADFYAKASFGRLTLIGTVSPPVKLKHNEAWYVNRDTTNGGDISGTSVEHLESRDEARKLGFDSNDFDCIVVRHNGGPGSYGGLGGGSSVWVRSDSVALWAHEIGHCFALGHSNFWDTAGTSAIGAGTNQEYGDPYDIMGGANYPAGHYNAQAKFQIKWLPSNFIENITQSGQYRIYAADSESLLPSRRYAMTIVKDAQRTYWGEVRTLYDAANPWVRYGMLLGWRYPNGGASNLQRIDTTPGSPFLKDDAAVSLGTTFSDLEQGIHLTTVATNDSPRSMDVVVQMGQFPGNQRPSLSLTASATTVPAGATVTFTASANDPDGDALAYGWQNFGDTSIRVVSENSPVMTRTFPTSGSYVVSCTVSDMKGGTTTRNLLITVGTGNSRFTISGRVTAQGQGLQDVVITANGSNGVVTDADGYYVIPNLSANTYSMTPLLYGYTFGELFNNSVTVGPNATGANFEATATPSVSIAATISAANEASPTTAGKFTLTRTGDLSQPLTVSVNPAQGSATKGSDYSFSPDYASGSQGFSTFTIPEGQESLEITVTPANDAAIEGLETIRLELGPGNGYLASSQSRATILLGDDESALPKVSVAVTSSATTEGSAQPAVLTLTRTSTAGPLTIAYSTGGTATPGTDYAALSGTATFTDGQATLTVPILTQDNSVSEPLETVQITLSSGAGYLVDSSASSASVNLIDDDVQTVTVAATDPDAQEVDLSQPGAVANTGTIVVTRTGDTIAPLTIYYAMTGTPTSGTAALHGVDYDALPGVLTFPAGVSQTSVTINPRFDGFGEGTESVILALGAGSTNYILGAPSKATVTIADSGGDKPYVEVVNTSSAAEPSTLGTFRLAIRGVAALPAFPVNFTVSGTATNGVDYDAGAAIWTAKTSGTPEVLRGLWSADASNVWTVGDNGTIQKWNGSAWSAQSSGVTQALRAIWGTNATSIWAVGDGGTILKWDGTAWSAQSSGTTQALRAVWGSAANSVWAAGDNGVILRFNGTAWTAQTSTTSNTLRGLWGTDGNNVWSVGDAGTILKYNGSTWSAQSSGVSVTLSGVWGTSATNLWAVGTGGVIRKGSGTSWGSQTSGVAFDLSSIWGADGNNVWIVGAGGGMVRTSNGGTLWSLQAPNTSQALHAVRGINVNEVWAAGAAGTTMNLLTSASVPLPTTVVIPPGGTTMDITVRPINDTDLEELESVTLSLNESADYRTFGPTASASMWVRDDDQPTVYVDTQVGTSGSITITEGSGGTIKFYVSRTGATTSALTVNYTIGGTATAGSDYTALSGTVVIPAGAVGADVPLTITNDTTFEGTETIVFDFAPGSYSRGPGTVMNLADNDSSSRFLGFSAPSSSGQESQTTVNIPVTLSSAAPSPVTVDYQIGANTNSISQTVGAIVPSWLRVVRNGSTITFFQSVNGVTWTQSGSAITLSGLSTSTYYAGLAVASGATTPSAATIDNFSVTGLAVGGTAGTESSVNLGNASGGTNSFSSGVYTFSTPGSGIAASSTTDNFRFLYVPVSNSTTCTVTARVTGVSSILSAARAGVMFRQDITNQGAVYAALMQPAASTILSGSRSTLNASSSSQPSYATIALPLWYRLTRTANSFATSISRDGTNWGLIGSTQSIALGPTTLAGLAVSSRSDGTLATATFDNVSLTPAPSVSLQGRTIGFVNVDGSESFSGGTWTVQGSGSGITGTNDEAHFLSTEVSGDFTLIARLTSLSGGLSTAQAGVMARQDRTHYSRSVYAGYINTPSSEQATRTQSVTNAFGSGVDFLLPPGNLTFAPGETTKNIVLTVIDDNVREPNDLVTLLLLNANGAGLTLANHGYTIVDNDSVGSAPFVGFASATSTPSEAAGSSPVLVALSSAAAVQTSVDYTVTAGSATSGTDYVLSAGTVTFPAGQTIATIPVPITQDSDVEGTETFSIALTSPSGLTLSSLIEHTISIADDDFPVVTIAATDASASESGADPGTFAITRSGSLTGPLTVNFTRSGSATSGSDFAAIATPGSVTIPDGQASATVSVTPLEDTSVEGPETVVLTLSSQASYTLGAVVSATVTIADNDRSTITIAANDPAASETAGNPGQFTITRTAPTTAAISVSLSISGTATNGSDYTTLTSTVSFAVGEASRTVNVSPIDDGLTEGEEVATVTIAAGAYDIGGSGFASVNIADNDNAPVLFISKPTSQGPLVAEGNGIWLEATVSDDGAPQPVTLTWSVMSGPGTATIESPTSAATAVTFSAPGTYVLRISATDSQFTVTDQCTVIVGNALVAANWITQDLGPSSARRGQGSEYGEVFSVSGTGTGYTTSTDQAHVMVRSVDGDCSIFARITNLQGSGSPLTGVTIRDAMVRGARRAVLGFVPGSGLQFRTRTAVTTNDTVVTQSGITLPVWVKLDRNAASGEITASYASGGSTPPSSWTQIGAPTVVPMDQRANVGLTTTSNSTATVATATLDQVSLTPAPVGPALISEDASTTPAQAGSGSESSGTYTIAGSTSGYFHGWQFAGDVVITAKHASATSGAGSATSGIRISENIESGAFAHVGRIPTGSYNGYYWRSLAGGSVPGVPSFIGGTRWIRIVRRGNSITAFHAADVSGNPGTWAQLGQPQTVIMTVPVFIGFWVDNASGVGLNTVTFNNLSIAPVNKAPVVDAGTALAQGPSSVILNGSLTDDNLPAPVSLTSTWSQISGPGSVSFGNPAAPATTASFTAAGTYQLRLTADDGSAQTFEDLTFTGTLPSEIAVEQATGGDLPIGSSVSFGTVNLGGSADRSFLIKNTGDAELLLTGTPDSIQLSGPDANQFSVTANPGSPVPPSTGVTGFTLRFTPTSAGLKTATVTIPNNDSDEGTYTLSLTGSGNSAPVLTLPSSPIIAEATGPDGAIVSFTATATDPEQGALIPTLSSLSGSLFPIGDTTVTANVTDEGGLTANGSFIVRVQDTIAPVITTPGNLSATATSLSGAVVNFTVAATDVVDGAVATIAVPASGSTFPIGTTTVQVTAVDSRNNTASATFAVTVTGFPEIALEHPPGSNFPSGGSVDFGTVNTGSNGSLGFTLRNTGFGPLNLTGTPTATLSGAHASQFQVSALPASPVAAGNGTSTFVVEFAPSSGGSKTATLSLPNNDADEGNFTILLAGTGNAVPTNIALAPSSLPENGPAEAIVGTLSATDADEGQTHTFSLVNGTGDTDNASFAISGDSLRLLPSADFETQDTYRLRVRAEDGQGGTFAKALTVSVTDLPELEVTGAFTALATNYGTPSSPSAISVAGNALSGDVTVTAPVGFEASLSPSASFGPTVAISPVGGTAPLTQVYLRLAATTLPGSHSGQVVISGGGLTRNSTIPASIVTAKSLTLDGATVTAKNHDGTTAAVITGTLIGVVEPDEVGFVGSGVFASALPGDGIAVTSTIVLTGAQASNYTFVQPTGLTGSILKLAQSITFPALAARTYGDASFELPGSSDSTLELTFSSTNPAVATISGRTVTLTGAGSATIQASQAGNEVFEPAMPVERVLAVAPKSLTVEGAAVTTKTYDGTATAAITGTLAGIMPGETVTFAGTGSFDSAGAGVNKPVTAALTLGGTHSANYAIVQPTGLTGTILKASQTITFAPISARTYGDPSFSLTVSATSGLPLQLTSSDPNVVTVVGTTATLSGPGNASIQASQAGDENFDPAPNVSQPLTVAPRNLTLQGAAVTTKPFDGTTDAVITGTLTGVVTPDVVGFSGTGSFASSAPGEGIAVTPAITLTGPNAGKYTFTQPTGLSGTIIKGPQVITFPALATRTYGDASFHLTGSVNSGLEPTFASSAPNVATVSGRTVTLTGAGSTTIRATQDGTSSFESATPVERVLIVAPKPIGLQGAAVTTKSFDGTTTATITGTLSGVMPGDEVNFAGTGTFASAQPGEQIPVTSTITLSGAQAANYALTQPTGLTGTIAPITISFTSDAYRPAQADSTVTLTLTRSGNAVSSSVTLRTDDGTAGTVPPFSPAVAGVDYQDADGTVITFAPGESSKTATLTLIPRVIGNIPNRRFSVVMTTIATGTPGEFPAATVEILTLDPIPPTLTMTTPASAGAVISQTSPLTLRGVAGDNRGLDRVTISLNGAGPVEAQLGVATVPTSVPWSIDVEPLIGPNQLVVTAYDLTGNSTILSRAFTFGRRHTLTLSRTGPEGLSLGSVGTVALVATPAAKASALTPADLASDPKSSLVEQGTPVTLTATARPGFAFTSWSGLPAGAVETGNVASFVMPEGNLTVNATFGASDVFTGPPGSGNTFQGLVLPTVGTPASNATAGFLSGTLSSTGTFSGRLLVDGLSQPITATFFGDGSSVFTTSTGRTETLSFADRALTLSYNAGSGNDAITATLIHGAATSTGTARRAVYSATNLAPPTLLNSAPVRGTFTRGAFTVALPSKVQTPPREASTYPSGEGYLLLTLTNTGFVTGSGILADGSSFSVASAVVSGNACPLFAQLGTPGQAAVVRGGSFLGTLVFDQDQTDTDVAGQGLMWFRPDITGLSPIPGAAALAASKLYPSGWPSGLELDAVGALYDRAKTLQEGIDLDGPSTDLNGAPLAYEDGKLVWSGGKLSSGVTKQNFIVAGSTVTKLPRTDVSFTLNPILATGTFTGTFAPNWTSLAPAQPLFRGVLLQKGIHKGGHGFFVSNALEDATPEAGDVDFTLEPNTIPVIPVVSSVPPSVSATAPYTISGTAGDGRGVSRVTISLNGGPAQDAILGSPLPTGLVSYGLPIEPAMGTNTVTITVYDRRGHPSVTTITFEFLQRFRLRMHRTAPSGVALDAAGLITLAVNPSTLGTPPLPALANASPRTSDVQNGAMVTLIALPRLGYAFTGWSGLPSGATTTANSASFPMPTSDLDVTADFATASSVFSGPVGSGATFHGLIRPESGTPTANSTVGFLSGTLTIPTGGFVGSVLMDGVTQPINATFHGNGSCVFNVGRTRLNELAFGGKVLTLRMNNGAATITAQVTSGGMTSSGLARRAVYSSTNPVPATLLNASATSGLATVAFPAKEQSPSRPTASYPQGDGFATATLSNLGVVTLTATLADNTTFTAISALVEGNECPFFGQILTPGSATQRGGTFSGTLKFDPSLADSDLTGVSLLWIRPALTQLTGTTAAALATQLYTDGWPAGLTIDALGTLYNRTLSVQSSLDLGAANIVTGNGRLESADGKLPTPVIKTNFNITGNTVAKIPIADPTFTLTVNATTGSFFGTFRPTWTSPTLPTFRGIILQKGANRGGFGFFLSNIPADLDPESGGVSLSKP